MNLPFIFVQFQKKGRWWMDWKKDSNLRWRRIITWKRLLYRVKVTGRTNLISRSHKSLPNGFHVQQDKSKMKQETFFCSVVKVNRKFHCLKMFSNFLPFFSRIISELILWEIFYDSQRQQQSLLCQQRGEELLFAFLKILRHNVKVRRTTMKLFIIFVQIQLSLLLHHKGNLIMLQLNHYVFVFHLQPSALLSTTTTTFSGKFSIKYRWFILWCMLASQKKGCLSTFAKRMGRKYHYISK